MTLVAPLVGAWIETVNDKVSDFSAISSLPSWERGLKQSKKSVENPKPESLPSWERGLKQTNPTSRRRKKKSLPSWERGLKPAM